MSSHGWWETRWYFEDGRVCREDSFYSAEVLETVRQLMAEQIAEDLMEAELKDGLA